VKLVYIVIVNWNCWKDTVDCLESLLLLAYPGHRVVLCDNGSTDGSLAEIRKWAEGRGLAYAEYDAAHGAPGGGEAMDPRLVLIRSGKNLGFAGGNNVGLRYALGQGDLDYAWLLNNDTVVEPDALSFLVRRMEEEPGAGMCGSTLRLFHDPQRIQAQGGGHYCRWIGLPWHYGRLSPRGNAPDQRRAQKRMNYVEGASMLVSRRFLEEVGLMCEDYFLYFEEADWALRARGRFTLAYAAQSVVHHKVGTSIGTSSNPAKKSYLCDFFNIRNRILFTRRFYPASLPTVYLTLCGALLLRLLLGKWDRAAMVLRLLLCPAAKLAGMVPGPGTGP